ncbi:hypothetical protein CA11_06230 [Gimesia maris]|uniref:Uncharacterized protein n=1 Tax=Gimesia maris TaxID=122 RepID=A0A3D3R2D0_9PLAN|nr:hypothetical protein [Gimesia sp.]QDT77202.1 hypothetical protein Mal35_06280 [Gimesia maris]QDU12842.1 hypothetical protein CA11_06230 [Gimesia maris]HCO22746.1 hypothetical protein [Gimesia maris]
MRLFQSATCRSIHHSYLSTLMTSAQANYIQHHPAYSAEDQPLPDLKSRSIFISGHEEIRLERTAFL